MKILVGVKRVIDHHVNIRLQPDGSGIDTSRVKMSMNPFDENAVEAALQLKEAGGVDEIIALSVGTEQSRETIRTALAMGADRGILLRHDTDVEPLGVAKIIQSVVHKEGIGLVILGKQAIDDDANQTGQMTAALLNWPQATFASSITMGTGKLRVVREVDGGLETIATSLPAVITADLRLNEPRFASLPNIMKARKKNIDLLEASTLGIDLTPRLKQLSIRAPASRQPGVLVDNVEIFIEQLQQALNA